MTPPPSPDLPLPQRLLALVQTLQYGWFFGHLVLLVSTFRYALSYLTFRYSSRMAQLSYRTAFIAAAATYGIVVYKAYRARMRSGSRQAGGPMVIAKDENAQYLAMAIVWLFSRQIPVALLPFAVYSIFHVATYTRSNLIPVIQPSAANKSPQGASPNGKPQPPPSALAETLGRFVKEYYDASMGLVALLELVTWFRLLVSFLTFSRGAIFLTLAYSAFLRARYAQSGFVQSIVRQLTARVDATVASQGTPPIARQVWTTFKGVMSQATELTDLSRYVNTQGARPKKAQ